MPAHGAPRVPGDAQDHHGDAEADQRVCHLEADRDRDRARHDREAYVGVGACVGAVGDQRRAVEAMTGAAADDRRDPVAREPQQPGPDRFDLAGAAICLVGVGIIMYAPRGTG